MSSIRSPWRVFSPILVARVMIGVVLFFNLQCALAFIWTPGLFASGFELEGVAGSALVRGMGILFLMWNIPYLVAVYHPQKQRMALYEAIAMQAIGLLGESILLARLPSGHIALQATATRFIAFDGSGLLLLILAAIISSAKIKGTFIMADSTLYQTIISTEVAAAHIDDPDWAFIDCRFDLLKPDWGLAEYRSAHIAGAVYADLNQDLSSPVTPQTGRHPLPESTTIVSRFSSWGIKPGTQVVIYDAAGGTFAARLWWLLKYYGHTRAAVLDGGLPKWLSENRPLRSGGESRPPAHFVGNPKPEMWVSTADVEALRQDPSFLLIDARAAARFRGEQEFIDPIAGHIPGAVNRFTAANLTKDGIFLPPERLKAEFTHMLGGLSPSNVIAYCGSGVTSCHNLLAMEYAGLLGARLYPGSWSEWIRDPNRPIEKNV